MGSNHTHRSGPVLPCAVISRCLQGDRPGPVGAVGVGGGSLGDYPVGLGMDKPGSLRRLIGWLLELLDPGSSECSF